MRLAMGLLIIPAVLALMLYFLPTMVGARKRNAGAIFALNLLLGWTLVGWVVSLVWALTNDEARMPIFVQPLNVQVPQTWTCPTCYAALGRHDAFCCSCGNKIAWPSG
jgi:hypothetical protein